MSGPLWTLRGVTLAGRPGPRLDGISLDVLPGATAVVGPSGAGKTSLLNLLAGFERTGAGAVVFHLKQPDETPLPGERGRGEGRRGTLRFSGIASGDGDATQATNGTVGRPLAPGPSPQGEGSFTRPLVMNAERLPLFWGPQDDGLWPGVTVRGHVELVARVPRETASVLLHEFELEAVAERTPERLSRGEAARVSAARAVASGAEVLVLDEPFAHVDPARRPRLWERLRRYVEETAASLVFVSHEPGDVLRYAQRAVALRDGKIAFDGTVADLYDAPPDEFAASLLGPANWLDDDERRRWGIGGAIATCIRPERLHLEPADGSVTVAASRSVGAVTETDLRCGDAVRRFVHRPTLRPLAVSTAVRLTVLSLCALLSAGCDPGADGPQLAVASERSFALPSSGTKLPAPRAIAVGKDGERFVLDNGGRVLVYDVHGTLRRQWAMPESSVGNPEGVLVLADGRIAVADTHYHRLVFFDGQGQVLAMRGELGEGPGQFIYPVALTADPDDNLYVAEYGGNDRIQKFTPDGKFVTAFGGFGTEAGRFQRPSGIVWRDGKIYVVDAFNSRIHVFQDDGTYDGLLDTGTAALHYPYDVALGPDDRLYVIEYGAGRLSVFEPSGRLVGRHGSTGTGGGHFNTPWGLAVDDAGRVWVADEGNRRIVVVVPQDAAGSQPRGVIEGNAR